MTEYLLAFKDPADAVGGDDLAMPIGYLIGDKVYVVDVINNYGIDVNKPACIDLVLEKHLNTCYI